MEGTSTAETDRRNVICQVFSDISAFIGSPLTTNGLNNKVNIWVRDINAVTTNTNSTLGLATGFYCAPILNNNISGIVDNEIWKTIHSGVDSYTNVVPPVNIFGGTSSSGGTYYHGMMSFNFTGVFNWNTNMGLTTIPSGDYDLYTVALHEITHALGFIN